MRLQVAELSIALLAHNEAHNIVEAIRSVAWAEQVVVVDAASTDGTGDIARRLNAEVIVEPNRANLNVNKNIAIRTCRSPWVLILDADERISDDLAGEIRRIIANPTADGFLIPRRNYVIGSWVQHGSQYPDWQLRLFRRERGRFGEKHVHERLQVQGSISRLEQPMDHHPYPDIASMIQKGKFYAAFEAGLLIEKGRRVGGMGLIWRGFVKPIGRFFRRYLIKGGFLDGTPGLLVAVFDAWNMALRWMMLSEHSQTHRMEDN